MGRLAKEQMIGRELAAFQAVRRTLECAFAAHKPDAMARTLAALKEATEAKRRDPDEVWIERVIEPKIASLRELVDQNLKTSLYVTDLIGPTAETAAKRAGRDVIVELHGIGYLDDAQVRAAARLGQLIHSVCAALGARAQDLNRTGRRGDVGDREAFEFHDVYRPWATEQRRLQAHGERHLDVVLDVAVWRQSVKRTRTRWQMSHGRCVQFVADGLADYGRALDVYEGWKPGESK